MIAPCMMIPFQIMNDLYGSKVRKGPVNGECLLTCGYDVDSTPHHEYNVALKWRETTQISGKRSYLGESSIA